MMTRTILTALAGWALVSGLSVAPVTVHAEAVTPAALKAAFILNFAKFTEWPRATFSEGSPLVLCVAGDDAVAEALLEIVSHQDGKDQLVDVRRLSAAAPTSEVCHVFYSGGVGAARDTLVDGFKTARVLTVSDRKDFCRRGGVVELFVDDGQMRFAINIDTARIQELQLSARLLSLAKVVRNN
jgi:hypothetical protein